MAYNPTEWKNGQAPALNATNLNKIEQRLKNVRLDAEDGLVVECRTDDPPNPKVGQIWLRTDLVEEGD